MANGINTLSVVNIDIVKVQSLCCKHRNKSTKMKFFVTVSFALLACAVADVSHLGGGYNYPAPVHEAVQSEPIAPQNTYIPPPPPPPPSQGYNYPAPVHEAVQSEPIAPQNTYIPPPPPPPPPPPQNTYIPPAPIQEAIQSQPIPAPQNTYIPPPPPPPPQNTYIPPAPIHEAIQSQPIAPPQNTYLPPSGYRYKTVRRVVYRRRF